MSMDVHFENGLLSFLASRFIILGIMSGFVGVRMRDPYVHWCF